MRRWAAARKPDLTLITGDLLSRPSAEPRLRALLDLLPGSFAVLGNHELGEFRDPFSKASTVAELGWTTVLADQAQAVELRGRRVQVVGVDPGRICRARLTPSGSPNRTPISASCSATSPM